MLPIVLIARCTGHAAKFYAHIVRVVDLFAQVYGGTISLMVGSYAWSQIGIGNSNSECGQTFCDRCSVLVSQIFVAGSDAVSGATGNALFLLPKCCFSN